MRNLMRKIVLQRPIQMLLVDAGDASQQSGERDRGFLKTNVVHLPRFQRRPERIPDAAPTCPLGSFIRIQPQLLWSAVVKRK